MTEWSPASLDFLTAVYRDETLPLSVRMKAAIAALPFEHPKLSVVTSLHGGFAAQLEAAMRRAGKSVVIDAKAVTPAIERGIDK